MNQNTGRVIIHIDLKRPQWIMDRPEERLSPDEFQRWKDDFALIMEKMTVLYEAIAQIDPTIEFAPLAMLYANTLKVDPQRVDDVLPLLRVHPLVNDAQINRGHFVLAKPEE